MHDIHIDDFYRDAALILIALYKHFPRKQLLFVEDISGPDNPDEFGLHTERHLSCLQTMVWLKDEGFIRFDDLVRQEAIEQAVLTQRAFLLLSSVVPPKDLSNLPSNSVLATQFSRVHTLHETLKRPDSMAIRQQVRTLLADACNEVDIPRDDLDLAPNV